jgi:peptidoglycan/xylan/chitin deacetylase (PgdA/CDA1 family)
MRKLYRVLRNNLTAKQKGRLSQVVNQVMNKPRVMKDQISPEMKFPSGQKGGFIISADFEMAWAWRYTKTGAKYLDKARTERSNFPKIIDLFDKYNIPITFATVGHLFLESCEKEDHDWMARIPHFDDHWKFNNGDWFDHDPCSNYKKDPEWYAPDLIQMIINARPNHEIGTHTFTHIDFTYKNCPPMVANDEIKACIEAAKPFDIQIKSLVFPGGTWGNIEALKKHGIEIYRNNLNYDLAYPWRDSLGLLVTNSSGSLEHDLEYGWTSKYFINRIKNTIDKAIKTNTIAHFWFHPSLHYYFLEEIFPIILEYASNRRNDGDLWIGTMADISKHINENKIL